MSFQPKSTALGKHAYFFREGDNITVPAAGNAAGAASRTNRPDATDPLYNNLNVIDDWTWTNKTMGDEKVYAPSPGLMQLYDIIEKGAELGLEFSTPVLQGIAVEIFMRTSAELTSAGGVFNPNSAKPRKGWLHCELYDNDNTFSVSLDVYGLLRITDGVKSKEGSILRPKFEFAVLYSTQNVGLINNS